jgi:lysozyme family protein
MSNTNVYTVALDERAAYELSKNAENTNIQKTIKKLKKSVEHSRIAEILLASQFDAAQINIAERSNARRSVYAMQKVVNVARVIACVETLNHFTRATLATAIKLQENGLTLTHSDALAACSTHIKTNDNARNKLLVRIEKHVAEDTSSTQSSSSINALQMFDVLRETRDAANKVAYTVNENDVFVALRSVL